MINTFKNILSICLFLFSACYLYAQENKFIITPHLAYSKPILSKGIGGQVGVNGFYLFSRDFGIEAQLSYNYTEGEKGFLNTPASMSSTFSALGGLRGYVTKNSSLINIPIYFNFLFGYINLNREKDTGEIENISTGGISVGAFAEIERFIIGLSFESPEHWVFRIGYNLYP